MPTWESCFDCCRDCNLLWRKAGNLYLTVSGVTQVGCGSPYNPGYANDLSLVNGTFTIPYVGMAWELDINSITIGTRCPPLSTPFTGSAIYQVSCASNGVGWTASILVGNYAFSCNAANIHASGVNTIVVTDGGGFSGGTGSISW